jgi:predicted secreted protein
MQLFSAFAVYFVVWWITLFTILPFGLRTQQEDGEVVLGTTESAPTTFHGWRVVILTTLVSGVLYAAWYLLSSHYGINIGSFPRIIPDFG